MSRAWLALSTLCQLYSSLISQLTLFILFSWETRCINSFTRSTLCVPIVKSITFYCALLSTHVYLVFSNFIFKATFWDASLRAVKACNRSCFDLPIKSMSFSYGIIWMDASSPYLWRLYRLCQDQVKQPTLNKQPQFVRGSTVNVIVYFIGWVANRLLAYTYKRLLLYRV